MKNNHPKNNANFLNDIRKGKKYLQLREKNEMKSYSIPFNSARIFQAAYRGYVNVILAFQVVLVQKRRQKCKSVS